MIVYDILFHAKCAIDSRFLHNTVLKSFLLGSTKGRIHILWQFDKLVTNCTKRVHKTVLIWGALEMGSMNYLWVSLGIDKIKCE